MQPLSLHLPGVDLHCQLPIKAFDKQEMLIAYPMNADPGSTQFQRSGQAHAEAFVEDAALHARNGWLDNVGAGRTL